MACTNLESSNVKEFVDGVRRFDGLAAARTWPDLKTSMNAIMLAFTQTREYTNRATATQLGYHGANLATLEDIITYCHSCGVNRTHDSTSCIHKLPGHRCEATLSNMMHGSQRIALDENSLNYSPHPAPFRMRKNIRLDSNGNLLPNNNNRRRNPNRQNGNVNGGAQE